MNQFINSFRTRSFRAGSMSLVMIVAVLALAVLLNVAVSLLPGAYTRIDTTADKLYALSDEAKEIIASFEEDIEILYIVEEGAEADIVKELLERAVAANPRITLTTIDPALHPELVSDYTTLNANSFVVRSAKREKAVDVSELYQYKYYADGEEIDESTYQTYYMYYQYGMVESAPTTETLYAGEAVLASAIQYVCTDNVPVVYTVSGHNEVALDTTFAGYLASDNISVKDLQLATSDAVPADAAAVIIDAPQADFSEEECTRLADYINAGGHVILYTYYDYTEYTNLEEMLNSFGMQTVPGIVMETSSNMYDGAYYRLFPQIESHDYTGVISGKYLFAPMAHGITATEQAPEGVTVSPILTTSDASFARVGLEGNETTIEKTDADAEGPFYIGAEAVTEAGGKLTWYSTPFITLADYDSNGAASDLFLATVESSCNIEASVSLATKPVTVTALTVNSADRTFWGIVLVGIIPIGTFILGLCVWNKRRKK